VGDRAGSVTIREVALRDGLQSEKTFVPTKKKIALVEALYHAGVKHIETTSFVSPKAIPQLQDAAELMAGVRREGLCHEVMVPNLKGASKAIKAGADRLIVFVSASDAHNRANVGCSVKESIAGFADIFHLAKTENIPVAGVIAVAFGCPYQGKVPREDVLGIANRFAEVGADRISLADTTGMANPLQITESVSFFSKRLPDIPLCLHLHNNRGIAMANLYAGYLAGVTLFDTSLGGIGGCPNVPQAAGNLATEDVVFMFEEMGVQTNINLTALISAARMLEEILGHPLPGQVMKSGST
jgi:hydroxymethylglutaryl-CoA lyase